METAFQDYGQPLEIVTPFKYLVRLITERYYDWLAVIIIFKKAQKSWDRISRTLGMEE